MRKGQAEQERAKNAHQKREAKKSKQRETRGGKPSTAKKAKLRLAGVSRKSARSLPLENGWFAKPTSNPVG